MKHRKIKSEIAFYLQNFDQIEYREYVDRQTRDCCRIIEKESGNKYNVSIEYDADGLTRIIRAKIQEK